MPTPVTSASVNPTPGQMSSPTGGMSVLPGSINRAPSPGLLPPATGSMSRVPALPATPAAPAKVDMTGVPSDAVAALSSSGLSGNELTMAQQALKDHYSSIQSTGANPGATGTGSTITPAPTGSLIGAQTGTGTQTQPTTQTGATTPTPTFSGLLGATAGAGAGAVTTGQTQEQQSFQEAQDVQKRLAALQGNLATGEGEIAQENIPLQFQQGRAQALQTMYGGQEQALATELQGLQGLAGTGATVQGQGLTALGGAAGTIKPEATYPFVFDPATGTFKNASTGGVLNAQDAAQAVMSGKLTYAQAVSSLGYLGNTGEAQLQQSILAAGGNPTQLAAQGAATQANIQTAGTAQTGTFNTIYSNATQQAATYSQQQSAINAIGNQVTNLMQTDPAINQFTTQFGNKTLNSLQTQLSDPKYAAFNTAIQTLQARIGAALQAGEIPSAATANAQSIANGNLTLNALAATLKQVDSEMTSFVGTQNALADYAKQQMQKGTTNTSSNESSNPTGWF